MKPRILLIRLSALGDIVVSLPAIAALRETRPDVAIDWLVEDRFAGLLDEVVGVDRVLVFPRGRATRVSPIVRHVRALRAERYEAAVDLQGNLKSAGQLAAARAQRKIGLAARHAKEGAHRAARERVDLPTSRTVHRAERARSLLAPLGVGIPANGEASRWPDSMRPEFRRHADVEEELDRDLGPPGGHPRVLIHPGTSAFGAFKRLPAATFGEVARSLADDGATVRVIHGPGEEALAKEVADASDGAAEVLPPRHGLRGLIATTRRADLVIASDSGPLHLAAAAGAATVGLFGPKDPAIYAPPFSRSRVVRHPVPCSPCSLRRCADPICMTDMTAGEVVAAARSALADGARP